MASTLSLEYLFDAARSRPDVYLPLLQERFEIMKESLIEAQTEAADFRISFYNAQDRFRKLEEAVETVMLVANKIIGSTKNEL
jgi:hypothetical protein